MAAKQRKQSRVEQRKVKNFERERKRQTGKEKRDRENDSYSSTRFQSQPYPGKMRTYHTHLSRIGQRKKGDKERRVSV